jgi:hypothetical protein
MEQAIFKTIVEMAYEASACDMVECMLQHMEEDFNKVKYWKSRKHWMTTSPCCDKNEHIPTHIYTVFMITANGLYEPTPHLLHMDYHKDNEQTVAVWHDEWDYETYTEFDSIKEALRLVVTQFRLIWQINNRILPVERIPEMKPRWPVSLMAYLTLE